MLVFVSVNIFQINRPIEVKRGGRDGERKKEREVEREGGERKGGEKERKRKGRKKGRDFKELIHGIVGANKSEICRADQHVELWGRNIGRSAMLHY